MINRVLVNEPWEIAMADLNKFPHDDTFPDNVNPTEENRKAHSDRVEKERREAEAESRRLAEEEDASDPEVVSATRRVPEDQPEPEANKRRRQNDTVN